MKPTNEQILKQLVELPCLKGHAAAIDAKEPSQLLIKMVSQIYLSSAHLKLDPIGAMRLITDEMEWRFLEALRIKRKVLLEIEAGTNNYENKNGVLVLK